MTEAETLSEPTRVIWGKSGDAVYRWLPLWRHLADTAEVAGRLWDSWCSAAVKRRIGRELPADERAVRGLVQWFAGVHDIGKATPAFATKVPALMRRMVEHGFSVDPRVVADGGLAPHATAGHVLLTDWLVRDCGWDRADTECLAVIVGGHHGEPPTDVEIDSVSSRRYLLGGSDGLWSAAQGELLTWIAHRTGVGELLSRRSGFQLSQPVQALLTALVIMADWIASNEEFFPYGFDSSDDSRRIEDGWLSVDLPTPWRAVQTTDHNTLFTSRFDFPAGTSPFPVQTSAVEMARTMPVPGLLIVEAPMGEGKTEAALAAAEILASRTGAGGCYWALPTRATADAMYARVVAWLRRLPDQDIGRGDHDVALVHQKAFLNVDFSSLYRFGLPSELGIDEGGADISVHRWLAGRKRKMLTNFAIGTIDQLLFAALKSRHVALRHLGLAGKVVVVDEAHAYDVYMSSYLDRALHWLGAHAAPVVVLSATLPAARRAGMHEAYDDGRLGVAGRAASARYGATREDRRYPLLTASGEDRQPTAVACAAAGRESSVRLSRHVDDPLALAETLRGAMVEGGCALVVCNTVARVQATARELRERLGSAVPVSVAHSRFMGPDRAAKDRWLLNTFGPPARLAASGHTRPGCHIVVASQVAEQSLDIDFDLLVTDLAPVDLLLQRIGRLHRHLRTDRPCPVSQPRCLVVGADWEAEPPRPVRGSVIVYGRDALLRSAAVLWDYLASDRALRLPEDIAPLVQDAYGGEPVGPATWQVELAKAANDASTRDHGKRERAKAFRLGPVASRSLVGWLAAPAGEVESARGDEAHGRAHVRDDGAESLEVLVLVRQGGRLVTPPWLVEGGGEPVPTDFEPPAGPSRTIASCSLPLPLAMTVNGGVDKIITELEERNRFPAWEKNAWLGGELVLDLDEQGRGEIAGFALEYDRDDGLRVRNAAAP